MSERRHLAEKLRYDVLVSHQQLDRLDRSIVRRLDQIFALDREEPALLAVLPRSEKLPDEPELLVLTRLDQAADASEAFASSEAFARSATTANACGSDTARSASDLRSSSIPASRTPAMKRL
ncbi:hypothetical protein BH20ACT14_BH20ACT14_06850 [soil metagenome]